MLARSTNVLELCRKTADQLTPGELMELRRKMQGLADWWLHSEVLQRMKQWGRKPRQPWLSTAVGSCWVLFAQEHPQRFPSMRQAFALPLQWRREQSDSERLPSSLRTLARAVARAIRQPKWGLHLAAGLDHINLAMVEQEFEHVSSCWAALACGLLLAVQKGKPNPNVWATGGWNEDDGVAPVKHLREKMLAAYQYGATEFFVPDVQFAEAKRLAQSGIRLQVGKLYTGTLDPQQALRDYLFRLDAPPPAPVNAQDAEGFHQCVEYYLRQPRGRRETTEYYRTHLLPTIIERCRTQRNRDYPHWKAKALITIVSGSPDLVPLSVCATEVEHCLLLYTPHEQREKDQTAPMKDVKGFLEGKGVRCTEVAFTDGPQMCEEIPQAITTFQQQNGLSAADLVLDITPGNKWMSWVSDHAMPRGSWRLYVRNDTLRPADRRPMPGSEELILWQVRR